MMAEAEAEEEMKRTGKKKETNLKRRAKPGKKGKKSWKRETSRKKELEEYERSSSDSSVEIVPEVKREKGELYHGGGLRWFPTESFVEKFK